MGIHHKNRIRLTGLLFFIPSLFLAQPGDIKTEPGKCYAKCLIPDKLTLDSEQILVREAYTRVKTVQPKMATVQRSVMVKAPSYRIQEIPAEYSTVTESVLVQEQSKKMVVVPAVFENFTEEIEIKPATRKIIPLPGEFATIVNNQVYMGAADGSSMAKGIGIESYDTAVARTNADYLINGGKSENQPPERAVLSNAEKIGMAGTIMPFHTGIGDAKFERIPMEYEVKTKKVELYPSETQWVKRKVDKNCVAADPDDCLVWCLVELPATYEMVKENIPKGCPAGFIRSSIAGTDKEECVRLATQLASFGSRSIVIAAPSYREEIIPAEFATVTRRRVVQPATTREEIIPAVYKNVTRKIITRPAAFERVPVPGEYQIITQSYREGLRLKPDYRWTSSGLVFNSDPNIVAGIALDMVPGDQPVDPDSPEPYVNWNEAGCPDGYQYDNQSGVCYHQTEVPPVYKSVSKKVVQKKGGYSEWREVVCASDITPSLIGRVQTALQEKGYDLGPLDNVLGAQTKAALIRFQKDNGLPIGSLDLESLRYLGVAY